MLSVFFFSFLIAAILLVAIGYLADVPISDMVGMIIILLLGIGVLTSGLSVKTGEHEIYKYGNNFTSYHWDYDAGDAPTTVNPNDAEAYLFHKNITDVYEDYDAEDAHTIGWLLFVFGFLGFTLSMFRL